MFHGLKHIKCCYMHCTGGEKPLDYHLPVGVHEEFSNSACVKTIDQRDPIAAFS